MSNILHFNLNDIQQRVLSLWDRSQQVSLEGNDGLVRYGGNDSVTLYMDMSAEDRCYLNCDGRRQLDAMLRTNECRINISTALSDVIENGQISITGPANNVLQAYHGVNRLLPITISFDMELNPLTALETVVSSIKALEKTSNIEICLVPQAFPLISVYLRANRENIESLQKALIDLQTYIDSSNLGQMGQNLRTKVDIPMCRTEAMGRSFNALENIGQRTSTQITTHRAPAQGISHVLITGSNFASICYARNEISDRLMVEMNFHVKQFQIENIDARQMEKLVDEYQVQILMKPSLNNDGDKIMVIRSIEKEILKLFDVRQRIILMLS